MNIFFYAKKHRTEKEEKDLRDELRGKESVGYITTHQVDCILVQLPDHFNNHSVNQYSFVN